MRYNKLGTSDLNVSRVCLGSMTWGIQNSQQEANEQIDYALSEGVNFIDTAEMYPVPPGEETYGKTESIIGNWIAENPEKRKDVIVASKIAGSGLKYIREGSPISGESVVKALDDSLKRLQTDYIDLYQLHWPNRLTPHFGKHFPGHVTFSDLDREKELDGMLEILQALKDCVDAGKIRYCGLSDDTPWGLNQYLKLSEKYDLPRMVSVQNEFSLIHGKDWPHMIENCIQEDVGYLPWSPLGGGMLSGKYLNGARPAGSRWTLVQRMGLFRQSDLSDAAILAYLKLAQKNHLTGAQLALAWVDQVDGVTSTIIGATSMTQLKENLEAFNKPLSGDLLEEVHKIYRQYPLPF